MQDQNTTKRRDRGDGSLIARKSSRGGETWIAKWRDDGKQIQKSLGPKRSKANPDGMTKPEAEAAFKKLRGSTTASPQRPERRTIQEVGAALVLAKRMEGRKPSTIEAYESWLRTHIVPFFGATAVHKIDRGDVERYAAELSAKGLSPSSVGSGLRVLHAVLEFAIGDGWVTGENPVKRVRRPHPDGPAALHFLKTEEVEALLRATPDDALGRVERTMYLTATMTGMRQGELLGLRWRDVDWTAERIRVRQSYVRGEFGSPKSKRSSRSVPLADRVAGELERLSQDSLYQADDDLVFANPATGRPMDRSKLLKRFKAALRRAGVERNVRFHDLRHTFGTRVAAQGVPMRTLQEWMGHRDFGTTLIYADYSPSEQEAEWIEQAFAAPKLEEAAAMREPGGE